MTKYTDRESYEKDKAYFVGLLDSGYGYSFCLKQIKDLIKQSKWVGDYPTETDINDIKLNAYADGFKAGEMNGYHSEYLKRKDSEVNG